MSQLRISEVSVEPSKHRISEKVDIKPQYSSKVGSLNSLHAPLGAYELS